MLEVKNWLDYLIDYYFLLKPWKGNEFIFKVKQKLSKHIKTNPCSYDMTITPSDAYLKIKLIFIYLGWLIIPNSLSL